MSVAKIIQAIVFWGLLGTGTAAAEEPTSEDYYYGFGVNQDYQKAFTMFTAEKNISYLVMMYINGDGRPKDLDKAQELLTKEASHCLHVSELQMAINERRGVPEQEQRRIGFCDLAYTTPELNYCVDLENRLEQKKYDEMLLQLHAELSTKAKEILAKIEQESQTIQRIDAARSYTSYLNGSIRGVARASTEGYIKERHYKRIEAFLVKRTLPNSSSTALQAADKELNVVYQSQRQAEKDLLDTDADPETQAATKKIIEEQLSNLKYAQLAWIRYRDLWVELLLLHRPKQVDSDEQIATSIKTILTMERTTELTYDPIGPH